MVPMDVNCLHLCAPHHVKLNIVGKVVSNETV